MNEDLPKTPKDPQQVPGDNPQDNLPPRPRVRDLYAWKSLNRPEKNYSKEVFSTLAAVALLVSVILAFFQEWLAILVVWAAFFLFWQLTRYPPVEVDHKITTEGLVSMDHSYIWAELGPFWFTLKENEDTLHIAHGNIFGELVMLIDRADQDKIREILAEYLPYVEVPEKSTAEKISDWFSKKFPLEQKTKENPAPNTPPPSA